MSSNLWMYIGYVELSILSWFLLLPIFLLSPFWMTKWVTFCVPPLSFKVKGMEIRQYRIYIHGACRWWHSMQGCTSFETKWFYPNHFSNNSDWKVKQDNRITTNLQWDRLHIFPDIMSNVLFRNLLYVTKKMSINSIHFSVQQHPLIISSKSWSKMFLVFASQSRDTKIWDVVWFVRVIAIFQHTICQGLSQLFDILLVE